jgi:CDP-2,3-bis-(O-geranylgeranyl)-sn-glycerol synthase
MANMAPPFVKYWLRRNRPISERWLGAHKTIVGFAFGMVAAIVTAFAQSRIQWDGALISYSDWPLLGLAMGFGALGGDALKRLTKRRRSIAPSRPWIPANQADYVIGVLVFKNFWTRLNEQEALLLLAICFAAPIVVNHISYGMDIRGTRWQP